MAIRTSPTTRPIADYVCPTCGGLECLCRPRFFAGQLLTEEDLNRLDHYIVEKNKLHNRYLHGWGVACGLEVRCHPCAGYVTVTPGYALSPCGDDIVVCREEAVNVCELLKKCRDDIQRHWECDPAWPRPDPNCDEEQPWVLYICYDEKPARGVTALRGGSGPACCSRCSCGGSSGCGCGCHETSGHYTQNSYQTRSSAHSRQARTLPQCEPTVTCEGYTFQIRKLPQLARGRDLGRMINRITECVRELAGLKQTLAVLAFDLTLSKVNAVREELVLLLERHGISNCDLYKRALQPLLALPTIPGVSDFLAVQTYFDPLFRAAFQECMCLALLPPCPEPVEDNCVPLATVTVNCQAGCRIVRVCNWEQRRIVPTVPSFEYWFEPFLRTSELAESLARFCCTADERDREAIDGLLNAAAPTLSAADVPRTVFNQLQALFKSFIKNLI